MCSYTNIAECLKAFERCSGRFIAFKCFLWIFFRLGRKYRVTFLHRRCWSWNFRATPLDDCQRRLDLNVDLMPPGFLWLPPIWSSKAVDISSVVENCSWLSVAGTEQTRCFRDMPQSKQARPRPRPWLELAGRCRLGGDKRKKALDRQVGGGRGRGGQVSRAAATLLYFLPSHIHTIPFVSFQRRL